METIHVTTHGMHTLSEAMKQASMGLRTRLEELQRDGIASKITNISHSSGFIGHQGYFVTIIAVVE